MNSQIYEPKLLVDMLSISCPATLYEVLYLIQTGSFVLVLTAKTHKTGTAQSSLTQNAERVS